jgi:hypothetical protein
MREVINANKIVVGKIRREETTWKTRCGWEINITVDIREAEYEGEDGYCWLRIRSSSRLLSTQQ